MNVFFKFNPGTRAEAKKKTVKFAMDHGAQDVKQLLPGLTDAESKRLMVANVSSPAAAKKLIAALGKRPEVEYAELGPKRELRDDG
jgi:hypothetical protein